MCHISSSKWKQHSFHNSLLHHKHYILEKKENGLRLISRQIQKLYYWKLINCIAETDGSDITGPQFMPTVMTTLAFLCWVAFIFANKLEIYFNPSAADLIYNLPKSPQSRRIYSGPAAKGLTSQSTVNTLRIINTYQLCVSKMSIRDDQYTYV